MEMSEFEDYNEKVAIQKNVLLKVLTAPKQAFTFIHTYKYDKYVRVLLILTGISRAFDRASQSSSGDSSSLLTIVITSVFLGGLFGWIFYYIYGSLISWTGGWLKGKAVTDDIIRVIAYATLPIALSLLMLIPQITIYGVEVFKDEGDTNSGGILSNVVFYGSAICEVVLSLWSFILTIIGVSVVQNFSIGKAFLNVLLPILIFAAAIFILIIAFSTT